MTWETNITADGIVQEASPESVGISSRHIAAYLQGLQNADYDIHSLQIIKDGKLIFGGAAAPYTLESAHRLLSAAKAILAAAVLFAIDEGCLSFESKVADFFLEELPKEHDARFDRITVYDLLTMQSGQNTDEAFGYFIEHPEEDLCRRFFETPMDCEPGTQFFYNNSIPHLLFYLVERSTGKKIAAYLEEKICRPLGMDITAQYNEKQIYDPVTTVVSSNGFLKLALWLLQEGNWGGVQLLKPELVRQACMQQTWTGQQEAGRYNQNGYCMQMWRNAFGGCRMDGGGGQIALILPEYRMAAVIMGNESRGELAISGFYEEILAKVNGRALAEDPAGRALLEREKAGMTRAPRGVLPHSETESRVKGKRYLFAENRWKLEELAFAFREGEVALTVRQEKEEKHYRIGLDGAWGLSPVPFLLAPDVSIQNRIYGPDPEACCLSGGWRREAFWVVCKSTASMGEYVFQFVFHQDKLQLFLPGGISAGMKQEREADCLWSVQVTDCEASVYGGRNV